jgi:hypothetical protein
LSAAALSTCCQHTSAYVSIRQHAPAYVSIRQHTSAYVRIRQHTSAYDNMRQHTSAYDSICQHTSAYVSIRQHTPASLSAAAGQLLSSTHQLLLLLLLARVRAFSEKHASLGASLAVRMILLLRRREAGALRLLCPRRMSACMRRTCLTYRSGLV